MTRLLALINHGGSLKVSRIACYERIAEVNRLLAT